jgi:molybdopterin-guanine dinucleotide biosynthesis protein A
MPQESGAQFGWVSNQISIARFQISVGKQLAPLSGFVNDPFEAVQWFPSTKRLLVTLDRSVIDNLEQKKMLVLKGKETYAQNSDSGKLGWRITNKYEAPDSPPDPKAGVTPAGLSLTGQPYIDNLLQRVFSSDEEYIVWSNIDKSLPEHLRRKGLPDDAAGVSALKASLNALRSRPVVSSRVLSAIDAALALIDQLENKPRTTLLGLMNVSEDTPQALTARIKQARWDAFKTWIAQEANHVASSLSVFARLFYAEYIPSLAHFERHDDGLHLLLNQILDREAPEGHEYAWQLLHLMIIEHELMQVRLRNYPNYFEPNLLIEEMALFYEVDLPRWNSFSIDEKQQIRRLAVFLRQENPALGNSLIDSLDRLEYYAGNWDSTSTWSKLTR